MRISERRADKCGCYGDGGAQRAESPHRLLLGFGWTYCGLAGLKSLPLGGAPVLGWRQSAAGQRALAARPRAAVGRLVAASWATEWARAGSQSVGAVSAVSPLLASQTPSPAYGSGNGGEFGHVEGLPWSPRTNGDQIVKSH